MTQQAYEGAKLPGDQVAHIAGDLRVTAGAPLTLILRQVDGKTLSVGQSSVDVLPGTHQLLVDCQIAETKATSRHAITVEVYAGVKYRLVAETAPGLRGCNEVALVER
ncbi:MAG TPA: hypothetical protein VFS24_02185 [Steroidobacteraceae bacterium]|nr:hypothetical protein [Steroidobacteraceae bacterium]